MISHNGPSQTDQILADLCINVKEAGVDKITIGTQNVALDNAYEMLDSK